MKLSVYIATTLDGFIARENGDLDWLPGSDGTTPTDAESEDFGYQAFFHSVDGLIMGKNTYLTVLSAPEWPYRSKPVIVLSNSLKTLGENVPETVELKSGSPQQIYQELQTAGYQHLYIDGGKTIQSFLKAGLMNELIITRIPILIGQGIPLFGVLDQDQPLQHLETKIYPNGFVQSRYRVSQRS